MMADNERCVRGGGGQPGNRAVRQKGQRASSLARRSLREYEKPVAYFSACRVIYVAFVF